MISCKEVFLCSGKKEMDRHRRMIGIKELSAILGLKEQTIRNKLTSGTFPIPTKKIGRLLKWDNKDVEKFLNSLPKIN